MTKPRRHTADWLMALQNLALRGLIGALLRLPYRWRVPLCGWVLTWLVAPVAGWRRRIRRNLDRALPGLTRAERRRVLRGVPDNMGRTIIEIYSGAEFTRRAAAPPLEGAGVAALAAAHRDRRPVILVSGHFGNYDASRAALIARGYPVGVLYKPMRNARFNAHYLAAMAAIGQPLFARGRQGLADMVRHLKAGGMLGLLIDQHMRHGARLTFFGLPAATALSAAELALRYDALVIPTYAVRQPDGLSFRVLVEPPIPRGTPEAMTQALNDSLEAMVRRYPDQWFWVHRRWKVPRHRGRRAGQDL